MSVLVLAEHQDGRLAEATLPAVTAARALDDTVDFLVAGQDCGAAAADRSTPMVKVPAVVLRSATV